MLWSGLVWCDNHEAGQQAARSDRPQRRGGQRDGHRQGGLLLGRQSSVQDPHPGWPRQTQGKTHHQVLIPEDC